jgi:hypothetical protein
MIAQSSSSKAAMSRARRFAALGETRKKFLVMAYAIVIKDNKSPKPPPM